MWMTAYDDIASTCLVRRNWGTRGKYTREISELEFKILWDFDEVFVTGVGSKRVGWDRARELDHKPWPCFVTKGI